MVERVEECIKASLRHGPNHVVDMWSGQGGENSFNSSPVWIVDRIVITLRYLSLHLDYRH